MTEESYEDKLAREAAEWANSEEGQTRPSSGPTLTRVNKSSRRLRTELIET